MTSGSTCATVHLLREIDMSEDIQFIVLGLITFFNILVLPFIIIAIGGFTGLAILFAWIIPCAFIMDKCKINRRSSSRPFVISS